jgi:hypothetical protein
MKKLLILILLLILLVPTITSQPPFQTSDVQLNPDVLTIVYPQELIYPKDTHITLPFDILNSNYTRLTNETTNCSYFVINNRGEGLVNGNLTYDDSLNYWYFNLTESETSTAGEFAFYVHCAEGINKQNGYVSLTFEINTNGNEDEMSSTGIGVLILMTTLTLTLIVLTFTIGNQYSKIATGLLSLLLIVADLRIATELIEVTMNTAIDLINNLTVFYHVSMWALRLGFWAAIIYLTYKVIDMLLNWRKRKKQKQRERWEHG